ncbi:membrane fusion protein, multidrug efflux system [Pelosinus fermentans]|uniref:efflux RND transporter periplasmic adaptor subunit n=1 Tax=Pelosinus fermentans TaxID=365349 RepID=UPI0002685607|nr:efflux RND transporter periplasmic adaptor subunit [Pelosinus fermentans]OAM96362.1 efflux transporter, RND family, MFP subunit [Pelosinus fermentans DSM 17108]SDR39320.1 membrane fusion protein, multidrug efflux system [Pelosinus fermentans]
MLSAKFRKSYCVGLGAIMIGLIITGCGGTKTMVQEKAVPVKAIKVIQQDVTRANEYAGQVQGKNEVKIQARVSGNIVEKMVSGGDVVKKRQPLFRIDSIQYESTLLSAQAQLVQAEANWENSRIDTERYQNLLNAAAISEQRLTTQKATERQNEALVASYRALVKKAQDDVNSTLVVSPIDGRIDVNDVGVGTYVQAGSTTLVTMGALDSVFVQFNMSENEYLNLRQVSQNHIANSGWGEDVMITLSNGAVYPIKGKVTQADRGLANNSGTLTLKASFANPDGILIPGMFARVKIPGIPERNAILVPQRAVQQVLDKSLVTIVNADNTAEPRSVILGEKVGSYYLIKEGLTANDTVVVEGLTKVQEGMALDVTIVTPDELELSINS